MARYGTLATTGSVEEPGEKVFYSWVTDKYLTLNHVLMCVLKRNRTIHSGRYCTGGGGRSKQKTV